MSYKNVITAETECVLGPTLSLAGEMEGSLLKGPHSFNPWPFLVLVGILLSCLLSNLDSRGNARLSAIGELVAKAQTINLRLRDDDVQSIDQTFDIKNPKKLEVRQKKDGKLHVPKPVS